MQKRPIGSKLQVKFSKCYLMAHDITSSTATGRPAMQVNTQEIGSTEGQKSVQEKP